MVRLKRVIGAAAMALACAGVVHAQEPDPVGELGWMAGSWASENDGRWTEEHWLAPRGGLMLGMGRSGTDDGARGFEYLRIMPDAEGRPVYVAAPGGGDATAFTLVESGAASAIFENAEHDYPQRIRYWREGDELFAEISAIDGSNAISWSWMRTD